MRFLPQLRLALLAVTAWTITHSTAWCQQTLWGMTYGSQFTVATTIERVTEVKIGDGQPKKQSTTEQIEIQYALRFARPTGVTMTATVIKCERTGDPENSKLGQMAKQQLGLLKGFKTEFVVDSDGNITAMEGSLQALQRLTDGSSESRKLVASCFSDEVVKSWLARPFWLSLPVDEWEPEAKWDQTNDLSLGFLGQLRTVATCEMTDIKDNTATINISGTSRHISPTLAPRKPNSIVEFQKPTATVEEFSGTATMIQAEEPTDINSQLEERGRPLFEKLDLKWTISGDATLNIGNEKKQVTFQQTRKESSVLLPNYTLGGMREFRGPSIGISP